MKKIRPTGEKVKMYREQLERGATQKELAFAVGISERTLRQIENANALIGVDVLDRLAKALAVRREEIAFATDAPRLVPTQDYDAISEALGFNKDRIIPRHDYDIASVTMDEGFLFKNASESATLATHIEVQLTPETSAYADELLAILYSLTWAHRSVLEKIPAGEEIATRSRIRQLLVLLKGNDIWLYHTFVIRTLPERYDLPPEGEPSTLQSQFVVTLGPPGEYGETSMRVPIDHGQPFVLKARPRKPVGGAA